MAISAYVGVPGSGKSFEVVRSVIIPAVAQGRRVVSNIYGLNAEKIYDYVRDNYKNADIGEVLLVTNEQVQDENFFPYKNSDSDGVKTYCQPGDLICVDEAWRIWASDSKMPKNHRSFLAEHRHFVHPETGVTCDLVVANQSITNLPRFIRDRIEITFKMTKLKMLGLNSSYRVEIYSGAKLIKSELTSKRNYNFDKKIFPLYQSYDGNGQEKTVDKRQSIFSSGLLWLGIIFFAVVGLSGVWFLWGFFHGDGLGKNVNDKTDSAALTVDSAVQARTNSNSVQVSVSRPVVSRQWRVIGVIRDEAGRFVVLSGADGRQRVEPAAGFIINGAVISGVLDGEIVTTWSGSGVQK
ncbi:zonular occludens toxin domain-containing protein [Klebsiella pneumoniae]|jgi:zona occludens toxin|uniref:Zonular occludens toxin n=1 Tax=Inoviridae sp. ctNqM18 TaxID=2825780 RepID=A0A8S5U1Z2_9VIRU|nr:zonular occludens toxin domain-containing protein [Klebsiella pneumoniae]DAF88473.1 MAG TPA: zonular occludens toxin [Inoviridae sp. ctNqM18]EJS3661792.1 zonular occludens toxin [Klebsiella pneumoniae]EKW0828478.1 zonular occludens toxin [Klebsiella pneumoniae]EKX4217595.1 zonular occludens toxin [Klebsiella pneumoniae]ELI5866565.1 zonular occludens toxin [Klebsiella pneumoniae]